jgi:hypothetical protein
LRISPSVRACGLFQRPFGKFTVLLLPPFVFFGQSPRLG